MKKIVLTIFAFIISISSAMANEGMWFLMHIERLNHRDMQAMGLQLTPKKFTALITTV